MKAKPFIIDLFYYIYIIEAEFSGRMTGNEKFSCFFDPEPGKLKTSGNLNNINPDQHSYPCQKVLHPACLTLFIHLQKRKKLTSSHSPNGKAGNKIPCM